MGNAPSHGISIALKAQKIYTGGAHREPDTGSARTIVRRVHYPFLRWPDKKLRFLFPPKAPKRAECTRRTPTYPRFPD
jgi:hypothetical protein